MERSTDSARVIGGRYRLVRRVLVDALGEVWISRDLRDGRSVSLRVLDANLGVAISGLAAVRALAKKLTHAKVAEILDLVLDDDRWVLVTALVPGTALSETIVAEGAMRSPAAARLARDVAECLRAIHRAGGVHGRLDPSRVVLLGGRAMITETGLGMLIGDESEESRTTIRDLNEPGIAFLSPEQAAGEGAPTPESDVWALGAVLYYALSGVAPYDVRTRAELAVATARRLPSLDDDEHALGRLIRACLAREPALRPSLDEFIEEARALIDPMPTGPTDVSTPGASLSIIDDLRADDTPTADPWIVRIPRPALIGGIFALFVLIGLVMRTPQRPAPAAAAGRAIESPLPSVSASSSASAAHAPASGTVAH